MGGVAAGVKPERLCYGPVAQSFTLRQLLLYKQVITVGT